MNLSKDDLKLAIEEAIAVTFHYNENLYVTIVDEDTVKELKQVASKRFSSLT